jgi:hypothetical protein
MTNLDQLLQHARQADPGDRISWRDPIAAHGTRAVAEMAVWLQDAKLGPFAARVLARIAETPAQRHQVLEALESVDPKALPEHVARDLADVINRIPGALARRQRAGSAHKVSTERWPGDRAVSALELRFHDAMLEVFNRAGEATRRRRADGSIARGYWANYFLRGVRRHGGPDYARQLLRAKGTTVGFQRLKDEGRLDLTMEALVLRPEFVTLFSVEDRRTAARRLKEAGYQPPNE